MALLERYRRGVRIDHQGVHPFSFCGFSRGVPSRQALSECQETNNRLLSVYTPRDCLFGRHLLRAPTHRLYQRGDKAQYGLFRGAYQREKGR